MKYLAANISLLALTSGAWSFQLPADHSLAASFSPGQCQRTTSSNCGIHPHSHSSSLFPMPMAKGTGDQPASGDGPSRKRDDMLSVMKRFMMRFVILRKTLASIMQSVIKRAKDTAATTLLINILLFGFVAKEALPSLSSSISSNRFGLCPRRGSIF